MNWDYSLEDLDHFKDLPHLVKTALYKIQEQMPDTSAYFFVLRMEHEEYREVVHEGSFSIPEESPFITYLALKNSIISAADIRKEAYFKDKNDEALSFLFSSKLNVNVLLPIVYRFRLLGFIAIALNRGEGRLLDSGEKKFLTLLQETLHINLYAALMIDQRIYELLSMIDLTKKIREYETYEELVSHIVDLMYNLVHFEKGVYYEMDEDNGVLHPRSVRGVTDPCSLRLGESISGYVLEKSKPSLINKLSSHVFFSEINQEKFITKAFIAVPFISQLRRFGVLTITRDREEEEFSVEQLYLLRILSSFLLESLETKKLYQKLERSYFETVSALATALEAKDPYTRGHSERVKFYSMGISEELKLNKQQMRDIKYAAILHDIGKIGISEFIITKPGQLTPTEYDIIKAHPEIGADILSSIDFLQEACQYVKFHHEKLDGSGYYEKKSGEYPWEATIINLADSYDALTSDRPYRKAIHPEIALKELRKSIDRQFDQKVFDSLIRFLKKERLLRESFV